MDIRAEVSPTKPPLTPSKALVAVMPSYMEDALRAMLNEIEAAYQPEKLKGTYSIDAIESDSGVMLELTVEDGALFESFVKGSVPHFPPWQDAEHPDGLPFGWRCTYRSTARRRTRRSTTSSSAEKSGSRRWV
jgi:hypothetical protein